MFDRDRVAECLLQSLMPEVAWLVLLVCVKEQRREHRHRAAIAYSGDRRVRWSELLPLPHGFRGVPQK
jgi:hypothetical protein